LEGETSMTGMLAFDISIFPYTQGRLIETLVIVDRSSVLMLTRKGTLKCGCLSGYISLLFHTSSAPL
jgi:hypothetical protein